MKFLVDHQLPPALARYLTQRGHESAHLLDLGMEGSDDIQIWNYAANHGYCVVSKDEDFLHLSIAHPNGPGLVWIRLGNCRTIPLIAAMDQHLNALVQALESGTKVVEVR